MAKTTATKKTPKPLPLEGESAREFRMRAVRWILANFEDQSFDDIVAEFNIAYAKHHALEVAKQKVDKTRNIAKFRTTKESITRTVKTLQARKVVKKTKAEDGRRSIWQLTN